jgi:hypothetical protein
MARQTSMPISRWYPWEDRRRPHMGAEIGRHLLAAGRTTEALAALENARPKQRTG